MKENLSRRNFIKRSTLGGACIVGLNYFPSCTNVKKDMRFGLVTYQWGRDWDLPTLIKNCEDTGFEALELRTEHAHAVETNLSAAQRAEVKKRFADSPVTCVGYGSNWSYHFADQARLREHIEQTKEYVKLCKDIGATGLKVKPDGLPPEVPREKTIAQIAASLNEVGKFAKDYGQLIRVEVHGQHSRELPNMKAIFDQVTESSVKVCWNSNVSDLNPPGIESNFNLVKEWIGDTVHVRELDDQEYPYQQLFRLLKSADFNGWILLEAASTPADRLVAMREQLSIFNNLKANI
jgi:sugar phosphate isomerase/epimerase